MPLMTLPQHIVTRFAPSPTGRLHIGHAWSALLAHDLAREAGGSFRLRIEDIDGARSRAEHVAGIIEDLNWLGLAWDGEMVVQSERLDSYRTALQQLRERGLVYPCFCTRADIAASASAPHGSEGPIYPGTCRGLDIVTQQARMAHEPHAWRIDMVRAVEEAGPLTWNDMDAGPVTALPLAAGDVVLARKDVPASYHLAATLDDAAMGVTHVVRGTDLREATHIHRLLQALLGLPVPHYRFHALLLGPDGRRIAKRTGGSTLAALRADGIDPITLRNNLRAKVFPIGISLAAS